MGCLTKQLEAAATRGKVEDLWFSVWCSRNTVCFICTPAWEDQKYFSNGLVQPPTSYTSWSSPTHRYHRQQKKTRKISRHGWWLRKPCTSWYGKNPLPLVTGQGFMHCINIHTCIDQACASALVWACEYVYNTNMYYNNFTKFYNKIIRRFAVNVLSPHGTSYTIIRSVRHFDWIFYKFTK